MKKGAFFQKKTKRGLLNVGNLLVKKTKQGKYGKGKVIQKSPGS